jgi:hypothetical protein
VRLRIVLPEVIKLPAPNEGKGSVTQLHAIGSWKYFEKLLVAGDKVYRCFNTARFHTPTDSCLVKLPRLLHVFFMCVGMVRIKAKFLHVRPSVRIHKYVSHWTGYSEIFIEGVWIFSKDLNFFKIGKIYRAFYIKLKYISLLAIILISIISLFAMEVVIIMLC